MMSNFKSSLDIFKYSAFAWSLGGRFFGTIASAVVGVTLGWQVYSIARETMDIPTSAFLVGMVGLVQFAPMFLLALIAGAIVDRFDRRLVVLASFASHTVIVTMLTLISLQAHPPLWQVYILAFLTGAVRPFSRPAVNAMTSKLVPPELLPRAIGWGSLVFQMGMVLGPWAGGVLCAQSVAMAYGICALTMVLGFLSFLMVRGETKPPATHQSNMMLIREGLIYIWTNKVVLGAISLDLFAVLLGGVTALLPVYARDILHVGAEGFGQLRAAPAIGGGLMALTLSIYPIHRRIGMWLFGSVAVYGIFTLVFAMSRDMALSIGALAILGAADVISVFVRQSLVQIVTPDAMRGRVSAVSTLFISASNELGEFESGVMARMLGPVGSAIFGGIGAIVVTLTWMRLFPALRKADRFETPPLM